MSAGDRPLSGVEARLGLDPNALVETWRVSRILSLIRSKWDAYAIPEPYLTPEQAAPIFAALEALWLSLPDAPCRERGRR